MRALVIGPCGQDGSYLVEQLVDEGHEVFGLVRRFNAKTPARQVFGDLRDRDSVERCLRTARPDVVFNLAAVTAPGAGWGTPQPAGLVEVTGIGVVNLLDAMLAVCPDAKLVHASSSAIYDPARYGLYGMAKQLAHEAVVGYRRVLHCSNAVLFSHTSPRQDPRFLARRICSTVAAIANGRGILRLTDTESRRDWGYAPDYMRAFRLIADHPPADWTIATGRTRSVRDLTEAALAAVGLGWDVVSVDTNAPRVPDEVHPESHEARLHALRKLGWAPQASFEDMVKDLVHA